MLHLLPRRNRKRGQILVLFELLLVVIIGFAALVIDLGVLRNNKQILVNTLDAAALAGGSALPVDGKLASTDPHSTQSVHNFITASIAKNYPTLVEGTDYVITYRCLVGADAATGAPLIARDIPGVCDPHNALHHNTPPPYAVASDFTGAGPTRSSDCRPDLGDKCNVVVVTGSVTTQYALAPVLGVQQGNTGTVVSAACKGACGAAQVTPVDLVIILDRTGSMADGTDVSGAKIQALQAAAETVLSVYDPAKQRVALGLTGPSTIDASGTPATGTCAAGGSAYGAADDQNFSPQTYLTTTGATNLFQGTFLSTTLGTAMTTTTPATITVGSTSSFPASGNFTIQIDSEQMQVKVASATTLTVVTRGYNSTTKATHVVNSTVGWGVSTTDTSIKVNDATGFPTTNNFTIQVDSEQMLVTAGAGTTTWTVTRGYKLGGGSTTKALHGGNEPVSLIYPTTATSIKVNSASGFPASGNYTIQIGTEYMLVTGGQGTTTWTVTRHTDSTTAATQTGGAAVTRVVGTGDTSIQVTEPHSLPFPSVPFMIAVGPLSTSPANNSNYEHMLVTAVSGSSAPYTWTLASSSGVRTPQDGTTATTHSASSSNPDYVDGVAPWVPSASTVGAWVPVGLSGTDTVSFRAPPDPTGTDGTYSVGGAIQDTPIVRAINCISAWSHGTNLSTPILMATWYLDHYGRQGVTQGIILETDGHPAVGFQDGGDQTTTNSAYTCQAAVAAATAAKADTTNSPDGIQVFTIGYGVDSTGYCPTYTTKNSDASYDHNEAESSTWSHQTATKLLSTMATDSAHYFENPPTSQLAAVFTQAATILAKGGAHLIQLYPPPIVDSASGAVATVAISGQYFTGASAVSFGGTSATSFSVSSDSTITAHAPAKPSGTVVDVVVTTPGGISPIRTADHYTYP